ncbi:Sec-independent protein translocase subunit TatA [Microbacterium sp. CJ88]|uniref:Sec-independent protein translocase subunit TatA n=1 Tax=Microbacterium sp. CJ88 TaxID=3445672 RepID=UPI003F65B34F
MLGNLTGWHFLILLAVILLVFGAAKLPALAKSMGQSARVFKGEMKAMKDDDAAADAAAASKVASVEAPAPAATTDAPSTATHSAEHKS